ncbi:MAG TPA: DUF5615 family PIN-like protein [Allosphingosinicella sp.]|nr:DUF5615 family PIN-like protein [Allosphingosinicella sp.]
MRFLIDAQLPPALCDWFGERGFEAEHVTQRLGGQAPDTQIAALAAADDSVLVTNDDDFALRHPPEDYRLLWLRYGKYHQQCATGVARSKVGAGACQPGSGRAADRGSPEGFNRRRTAAGRPPSAWRGRFRRR